jgi:predicted amidohydrolase/predicted Zn-dependent protease with MMP-like domain
MSDERRAIAVAQTVPVAGDVDANIAQHVELADAAADAGARIVVFPELSLTGYELGEAARVALGPGDQRLAAVRVVAEARHMTIVVGAAVRLEKKLHIAAVIVGPGGYEAVYTKRRLGAFGPDANPGGAIPPAENTIFEPGDRDPLISVGDGVAAVAVCADIGAAAHAEAAARRGARTYLASMFVIPDDYAGDTVKLQAYALQHQMAVAFANYGGPSGGLRSAGGSAIWSQRGELLTRLPHEGAGIAVAIEADDGWRTVCSMATKKIGTSWAPAVSHLAGNRARFEQLVAEALDSLPEDFARAMENVDVIIEDVAPEPGLLGLYEGVPQTDRGSAYAGVLPDRITIFRRSIERIAKDDDDLQRIVRDTVVHEIAHHFGISDARLRELGAD